MVISVVVTTLALGGCRRRDSTSTESDGREIGIPADETPAEPPVAYRLGELAPPPDWKQLEAWQRTISREEFLALLTDVFSEGDAWTRTFSVADTHVDIRRSMGEGGEALPPFRLHFAPRDREEAGPLPPRRFWRDAGELPPVRNVAERPLEGVRIAIDPGHIGGEWARMEERWFAIGDTPAVMEGDMTLTVAKLLKPRLEALGAEVTLLRTRREPVTPLRPTDLEPVARSVVAALGGDPDLPEERAPHPSLTVRWQAEKLFYRTAEIRARAELVNERLRPDLVVCLHFNAEPWGNPAEPDLVDANHLHLLVNGCYSAAELALDDQRFAMIKRLLQRTHRSEAALSASVAESVAQATGLPPYEYPGTNARRVSAGPYVWARNLLANRVYDCPVVFLEPYVMNSREVHERVLAGDYDGTREIAGALRPSIFREYADAVADGLARHFRAARSSSDTESPPADP